MYVALFTDALMLIYNIIANGQNYKMKTQMQWSTVDDRCKYCENFVWKTTIATEKN